MIHQIKLDSCMLFAYHLARPKSLQQALANLSRHDFSSSHPLVVGQGWNTLFTFSHFSSIVSLANLSNIDDLENYIYFGSGCSINSFVNQTKKYCRSAEYLQGIPGSLGGAVYMNAGAFGITILDFIHTIRILDSSSTLQIIDVDAISRIHRTSSVQTLLDGAIILEVTVSKTKLQDLVVYPTYPHSEIRKFRSTNIYSASPSLGSIFKTHNLMKSLSFNERLLSSPGFYLFSRLYNLLARHKRDTEPELASIPCISNTILSFIAVCSPKISFNSKLRLVKEITMLPLSPTSLNTILHVRPSRQGVFQDYKRFISIILQIAETPPRLEICIK